MPSRAQQKPYRAILSSLAKENPDFRYPNRKKKREDPEAEGSGFYTWSHSSPTVQSHLQNGKLVRMSANVNGYVAHIGMFTK